ncbi:GNAT family N-acetyltransferase [Thalassospira lucentensis]|uniref:GNAT family N-acetyltransferase n=1 Tax=Thalassospira lucentensis TaxID=168935 RepID=A0A358HNB8_9PROT|nr:GNAT family N-acetyltransferase [Thalassospira lucentensis]HBU96657.1 GNAT family N-acetyltransferase [Thalassospira lucentensis]
MKGPSPYSFRRAIPNDLSMIRRWLYLPEVIRWWGDPVEQIEIITEDIELAEMATLIVSYRNRPFAFVQHYDAHQWPQDHFENLPAGTRCMDSFIGVSAMMGCGHGQMFLSILIQMIFERGAPMIAIDPDPKNERAIRCYEAIGFIGHREYDTSQGPCLLMTFDPKKQG